MVLGPNATGTLTGPSGYNIECQACRKSKADSDGSLAPTIPIPEGPRRYIVYMMKNVIYGLWYVVHSIWQILYVV